MKIKKKMEKNKKCIVISFADSNKKGKLLKFEDIVKFFKKRYEFGDIFMISSYNNWFGVYYHIIIDCKVDNSQLKRFIGKYKVSSIKIEEEKFSKYHCLSSLLINEESYLYWYDNSTSKLVILENGYTDIGNKLSFLKGYENENWLDVEESSVYKNRCNNERDKYILKVLYKIVKKEQKEQME